MTSRGMIPSLRKSRWTTLIGVAVSIVLFDQWTKLLAVEHLTPGMLDAHGASKSLSAQEQEEVLASLSPLAELGYFYGPVRSPCDIHGARCPRVHVIGGFWDWHYAENPGAAWSMFAGTHEGIRLPFLISVSMLAIAFIVLFVRKLPEDQRTLILALSLICGGAIGNLIDRARLGYVIDFVEWYSGHLRWPTFNLADSAITTGVVLIVFNMLLELRKKKPAMAAAGVAGTTEGAPGENGPLASSPR